jgi:hypothetical protein
MKAIGYNTHEGIEGEKSRGNQASSLDIPTSQQRRSGISRSSKRRKKKEDERNDSLHRYKATSPSSIKRLNPIFRQTSNPSFPRIKRMVLIEK